jgi:hypothetical protein
MVSESKSYGVTEEGTPNGKEEMKSISNQDWAVRE